MWCVCVYVPMVITSPTAGVCCVYFDGKLEGGGEDDVEESMLHPCRSPGPAAPLVFSVSLVWWVKEAEMEGGGWRNESWDVHGVKTACLNLIILKQALRKT